MSGIQKFESGTSSRKGLGLGLLEVVRRRGLARAQSHWVRVLVDVGEDSSLAWEELGGEKVRHNVFESSSADAVQFGRRKRSWGDGRKVANGVESRNKCEVWCGKKKERANLWNANLNTTKTGKSSLLIGGGRKSE